MAPSSCRRSTSAKTYGVTHALKGVNFEVRRGKVTVLFGENGAGKSTLMKILSGVEQPTGGQLDSRRRAGRSCLHQRRGGARYLDHPPGAQPLRRTSASATTSSSAASCTRSGARLRPGAADTALMARLEETDRPDTLVDDLRIGQQQIVEIARALAPTPAS